MEIRHLFLFLFFGCVCVCVCVCTVARVRFVCLELDFQRGLLGGRLAVSGFVDLTGSSGEVGCSGGRALRAAPQYRGPAEAQRLRPHAPSQA